MSTSTTILVNYEVRVTAIPSLKIRNGASTNFSVAGSLATSTIVVITAEANGAGANRWGRLRDGRGWIALDFTTRITPPSTATQVRVNSRVRVRRGAQDYRGGSVAAFIYDRFYTVDSLTGNRAVLDTRGIHTAFNVRDLEVV